ncbi:MAG TPA: hypothetical protein V6D29_09255 [Leptolyngbyaceae cyanobacterium]
MNSEINAREALEFAAEKSDSELEWLREQVQCLSLERQELLVKMKFLKQELAMLNHDLLQMSRRTGLKAQPALAG